MVNASYFTCMIGSEASQEQTGMLHVFFSFSIVRIGATILMLLWSSGWEVDLQLVMLAWRRARELSTPTPAPHHHVKAGQLNKHS